MLKLLCELESITPVLFNKKIISEKGPNENNDEWELRVWRERCDCNGSGELVLVGRRFKKAIYTAAQWLNLKIPGEGKATYTKHFKGGVMVTNPIPLKVQQDEVDCEKIFTAPRKNDGKRWIHFPIVREWKGDLQVNILDEKITEEIFQKVLDFAGMSIGVGSGRPEVGGENGRFECLDIAFEKI